MNPLLNMINNNPIMKFSNAMKNGGNISSLLSEYAGDNQDARKVLEMYNCGNTNGLKDMAMKMAKEKGINIDDFAKRIGI